VGAISYYRITPMGKEKPRTIVHVDMDAFFTSIEQLDNEDYRGRPVVVGADPKGGRGRGVVSASSYEARKYGIYSAMPISRAYRLCPDAIFLRPRFSRYSEISHHVMEILDSFSPLVEPLSIDEAFMDCTGTENLFGPPAELGMKIKNTIRNETGLTASVGIAPNKSIAKIASDLQKPDGLTICQHGMEREFLSILSLDKLWGAGEKTVKFLHDRGFKTIGDVAAQSLYELERTLGKWGTHLWLLANGIDDRPVTTERRRRSISEEITFDEDVADSETLRDAILSIADRLSRRMRHHEIKGRTVTLKIRLEGFVTFTRARTLNQPIDDMFTIRDIALKLYENFDRQGKRVRLIGIGVSNLEDEGEEQMRQLELFSSDDEAVAIPSPKRETLEKILDDLKENFGDHVSRASLIDPEKSK
jgi:DNA polymerase-4